MTGCWHRIRSLVRKFVSDPLVDRLATEIALCGWPTQHRVDARVLVSVVQPLQRMVVVAEVPIDWAMSRPRKRTAARARQRAWLSLVVEGKGQSLEFPVSVLRWLLTTFGVKQCLKVSLRVS